MKGQGDPGDGPGQTKEEASALKGVVVNKFSVDPLRAKVFDTVTVTWDVTVPTTIPYDVTVTLNGREVATSGTESVRVETRTNFALGARTEHAGRSLKQLAVVVDESECQQETLAASIVVTAIKNGLDDAFGGSGQFSLKPGGSQVSAGSNGEVNIDVPITISVPDWFDADMDISLQLMITGHDRVFVTAPVVDPHVGWSWYGTLSSLGIGAMVGDGMTQISKVFLEYIVDAVLRPTLTARLEAAVQSFLDRLKSEDSHGREFHMTTLLFSEARGLQITACPA